MRAAKYLGAVCKKRAAVNLACEQRFYLWHRSLANRRSEEDNPLTNARARLDFQRPRLPETNARSG